MVNTSKDIDAISLEIINMYQVVLEFVRRLICYSCCDPCVNNSFKFYINLKILSATVVRVFYGKNAGYHD